MHQRAAILIQRASAGSERQADICAPYCLEHRIAIQTIVPHWAIDQAAQLVRDRLVDVVVVAFEGRGLTEMIAAVADAGGKVIAIHPKPRELAPPRRHFGAVRLVSELIGRLYRKGRTVREIAELVDSDTTDIRSALARLGLDPYRK